MILIGLLLLLFGYIFSIGILYTLGWIALAIGVILLIVGMTTSGVGGRKYWY